MNCFTPEPRNIRVIGKKRNSDQDDSDKDWPQVFDGYSCVSYPIKTQRPLPPLTTWHAKKLARIYQLQHGAPSNEPCTRGPMSMAWFKAISVGVSVGKYIFSIRRCIFGEEPGVVVFMENKSSLQDGTETGSTVVGILNNNLRPIQEHTYSWIKSGDHKAEHRGTLIREADHYFYAKAVTATDRCPERHFYTYSFPDFETVVTEAGNAVLQKLMVIEHRTGGIKLKTLTTEGAIVSNDYTTLGTCTEIVQGEETEVIGIRRSVITERGYEEWDSIFTKAGRLVLKCQIDKDHAMIPLWYRPRSASTAGEGGGDSDTQPKTGYPPLLWTCDAELYALYLERKELEASEMKSYLLRNPALRALLADFVQAVLIRKPDKIMDFAGEFFQPYLSQKPEVSLCISDLNILEDKDGENC